jgi:insertion element IS1 protein InsB
MIQATMTHVCRVCERTQIVNNGTNRCGNAQSHCKDCGTYRVLTPKQAYAETEQRTVLRACLERCSLRGVARIFAIARQTVALGLKAHVQKLPDVKETLLPATPDDVLELDAHLELCAEERAKTLGVDGDVPSNPPNRRLRHR